MTETWLPQFEKVPGPGWKQGYFGIPSRPLSLIEGSVIHDAAGPWTALIQEINHPTRQASWTISIPYHGPLPSGKKGRQHYPLEAITWHCGKPGDNDLETAYIGNVTLLGRENARPDGNALVPLSDFQVETNAEVDEFLRNNAAAGRYPPELAVNLFEHNWISNVTECPSRRVPWAKVLEKLEDDMKPEDIDARITQLLAEARTITAPFVRAAGQEEVWKIVDGRRVWLIDGPTAIAQGMNPDFSNVAVINAVQLLAWPEGSEL